MSQKPEKHSASFKAKVALTAILGEQTIPQIARQLEVHPSQTHARKKALLEGAAEMSRDIRHRSGADQGELLP